MINKDIIRYIKKSEIDKLQKFIKINYSKSSILSKNKNLINFYYNYHKKSNINFLGYFKKNKLVGVAGIIKLENWDKKLLKNFFLGLLVKDKKLYQEITFSFFNYIYSRLKPKLFVCSGFNNNVKKIYKKIGQIEKFSHYYIFNENIKSGLSKNLQKTTFSKFKNDKLRIKECKKLVKLPKSDYYPIKSKKYFTQKYSNNPFYKYSFLEFKKNNKLLFFFVIRKIKVKKNISIVRIVDFYGKLSNKNYLGRTLKQYLQVNNYEYIDFLCIGLENKLLKKVGFNLKKNKQLIPNYFEPYIKKNIKLELCTFINNYKNCVFFKADGDQDRPNII